MHLFNTSEIQTFFQLIEQYDVITIFRHIAPDGDALGSQFGLKQYILDTYPHKQVYALGYDGAGSKAHAYPVMDSCDDEVVQQSLAIVLDCANAPRVDDQRFQSAAKIMTIDHHIKCDSFADVEIVYDLCGATCEILTGIFEQNNIKVSAQVAQYLYMGFIADTLRFTIPTITSQALRFAAYLIDCGANPNLANEAQFSSSLKSYKFENFLRSNIKIVNDHMAYAIVTKEEYEAHDMTFQEAKEKVFVMGGIKEFKIWALFTQKADGTLYNGSLRANKILINDIASNYRGGGHRYACGVKDLTIDDIQQLLNDLEERIYQNK